MTGSKLKIKRLVLLFKYKEIVMKRFDEVLFNRFFESWKGMPVDKVKSLVRVKAKVILPSLDDVDFSKVQRIKLGIDGTGSEIHIGHMCPVFLLNIFVKTGHHVTLVIGDFTAKIGDPSGRVTERAVITDEQIAKNVATYTQQMARFVDTSKFDVRKNSEWLSKTPLDKFLMIHQNINLATSIQREDFRIRLEQGGVSNAEVLYASLMGLDSVALETTIELGGIDQLLNLQQCREVQRLHGQKPEVIITTPILEGLSGDGRKMSKSFSNYVAVNASAEDKFGKLMSLPDNLLVQYFKCFGYLFEEELGELEAFIKAHPMEAKKQLASYFVAIEAKNMNAGLTERAKFEAKFSKRELQESDFAQIKVKKGTMLLDALLQSGKFKSKGELKRLIDGGAMRDLDAGVAVQVDFAVMKSVKVKVGKLNFFAVRVN